MFAPCCWNRKPERLSSSVLLLPFLLVALLLSDAGRGGRELRAESPHPTIRNHQALHQKAMELAARGELSAARSLFRTLHNSEPNTERYTYHYALALLYFRKKETGESPSPAERRRELQEAVRLLEECVQLLQGTGGREALALRQFHLGMAWWYLGETARALASFRRSSATHPLQGEHYYNLYRILLRSGHPVEANSYRRRFLQLTSSS